MQRYALRDDQWAKIKDFLPGREGHVGGTATDNRLFVDAIIYRTRTGIPWRDLPERYGDWKPTHKVSVFPGLRLSRVGLWREAPDCNCPYDWS